MSNNEIAFFIGIFSSMHCIGMCGPLAFALPVKQGYKWLLIWDKLLYNFGRIVTYAFLGLLVGLLGKQLWLAGLQRWVSLLSGMLVIIVAIFKLLKVSSALQSMFIAQPLNRLLIALLKKNAGHFVIGVLNGFLPCGFVYLALAGAVGINGVTNAVEYMVCFGLGTMPLMLLFTIGTGFVTQALRKYVTKFVPYFMLFLGIWFMLRGLQLDIPYLSMPQATADSSICK
ncbi:sulfite exporter TauE/SafE family protein [Mucilaginibacter aquatilis]|uniref:Sulfite exporter TauE/SafE family protein n=1 Tax=Mucilaginibacter aquatilis TaxID=1517760 RepID=A0A6I4I9C8_9SPHI|nr:sulfite exporter TauE/SafE family protein [Mucilaginibacter aquatilis]MVN90588.1 sulfite exporter TauE/SafE family protein [Mucilaginibacter aquatilis]